MVTLISPVPQRVRASPARDPRPADPVDRAARARRPRRSSLPTEESDDFRLRRRRRRARAWRARQTRSTFESSPSPIRSRTAAWASRLPAATAPRMRVARAKAAAVARSHSLSRLKEEPMRRTADRRFCACSRLPPATRARRSRPTSRRSRSVSAEQKQLHAARCRQPRDRPQARDLRCRLHLQARDRCRLCRHLEESRHVDGPLRLRQWRQARDWAIFAGPDGSAQVRDCKDIVRRAGLPSLRDQEAARRAASP